MPRSLVIRRATGAGIRQVHHRSITSPRQVHDRLRRIQFPAVDTGNLCCLTPQRPGPGTAPLAYGAVLVSIPVAATHTRSSPPWSLDEMTPPIRQPAAWREQDGEQPADRMRRSPVPA